MPEQQERVWDGPRTPERGMLELSSVRDWETGAHLGGLARCYGCGWEGAPTYWGGEMLSECPSCEGWVGDCPSAGRGHHWKIRPRPKARARTPGVRRNAPCPCGSGVKAKKCCHA